MPITCLFRGTLGARGLFLFDALCACCIGPWPTQGKVTTTIHWRSDGLGLAAALRERQRDRRPDSMDGATMLDCAACLIRVTGSWERGRRSAAYRTQAWAHDEDFCAARCPLNGWLAGGLPLHGQLMPPRAPLSFLCCLRSGLCSAPRRQLLLPERGHPPFDVAGMVSGRRMGKKETISRVGASSASHERRLAVGGDQFDSRAGGPCGGGDRMPSIVVVCVCVCPVSARRDPQAASFLAENCGSLPCT